MEKLLIVKTQTNVIPFPLDRIKELEEREISIKKHEPLFNEIEKLLQEMGL